MGVVAKKTGSDVVYDPIPEALHISICYGVFDLGIQHNEKYGIDQHKVLLVWELPEVRGEFEKDGETKNLPRAISQEYTLSLSEKSNLRHDLETWRSKGFTDEELEGFDLTNLLNKPCQIQVIHKKSKDGTKIYSNVGGIVQAPKGFKQNAENTPVYFSFPDHGMAIPESTPEWIVNKIKNSKEWKELTSEPSEIPPSKSLEEELPF